MLNFFLKTSNTRLGDGEYTVGRNFALHSANLGWIPGIPCGTQGL